VGIRVVTHTYTSRTLTHDDNLAGIAAKGSRIVSNPLDSLSLVSESQILIESRSSMEAKDVDAVVDRHHHDIFGVSEVLTVEEWSDGVTDGPSASVKVDQDGLFGDAGFGRGFAPYV